MSHRFITGNRLKDGVVVWLSKTDQWVESSAHAQTYNQNDSEAFLETLKHRDDTSIVDIRAVEVEKYSNNSVLIERREQLRAEGPSVRPDLSPEAGGNRWAVPPFPLPPSTTSLSPFVGMYHYDESDRQFLYDRAEVFRDQIARRLSGELTEDEFKPLRLMNGLYLQLHGYMFRVALPYGVLSAAQMRQLAYIARYYDRGYGHFTTRQNIQFNWIRLEDAADILTILAAADLHATQTSGNCVRNVTTDHFAGAAKEEIIDPRLYAEIMRQWSTDHPEFTYLPRKFKIAITGSPQDRAAVRVHDIGLLAHRNEKGEPGFQVYAGGGLGRTPIIGTKVREWLPVKDLLRYVESILRVYNSLGRRDNIYKARIKILIREMKPEHFIALIEKEFESLPADYNILDPEIVQEVERRFGKPPFLTLSEKSFVLDKYIFENKDFSYWVSSNTHQHYMLGYISAVISLKPIGGISGDVSSNEMDAIADIADQYSFGEIRVSHEQNIVLPHVRKDDLFALWNKLVEAGLATSNVGLITDIIACPGMDYCSLATARSIPIAQKISKHFENLKKQQNIGLLDLNISGCINACAHHHVANIGLLGVDRNGEEVYQITLGGSGAEQASIGNILGPAVAADKVTHAVDAIVQAYLDNRLEDELFIDTYRRTGAKIFREAVYGTC
ncbi:nitrite/sulfite reductase [Acetobacter indonesiensis NRIC 0313]|uniref:Sulfite reductase n=1 Tax=Acetobacter indonesiensis TaxID=104101 RepID=A0A6N3TA56_9PROT|nr:DUF2849 domain-containing protein [Acetobacter indonesiensis]GAN61912.1 nitrite/sulfite reductase [Acetobacter indonesiensis]GBQ59177.1 nitrite/sulfite reductase [Acetobacter indonesiensis NRIC 0313]GEN04639.1 sulfite reductase [Acetobacter indonesiensis]